MGHEFEGNGRAGPVPFGLKEDAWGRLVLTDSCGRVHTGVLPVRAFPVSDPRHHVALCDAAGRELLWVEDLDALPGPLLRVLEEALARREFVPVLRRVVSISAAVEPTRWEVETDRGLTSFVLDGEDDVRRLGDHRALIVDAHGIRYLIPDLRQLDPGSRRLLERYL